MTPHKHHDLIVAWAKGAKIQWKDKDQDEDEGDWLDVTTPQWSVNTFYRIKPEPKPDVVKYKYISEEGQTHSREYPKDPGNGFYVGLTNLKLTLDGETGKLKKAEVIDEA